MWRLGVINVDPICRYIPTEGAFPAVVAFKSGMQIIGHTPDEIGEAVFDIPDLCILRTENNNEIFAIEPAKAE